MRRIQISCALVLLLAAALWAGSPLDVDVSKPPVVRGQHIYGEKNDLGTSYAIIASDSAYAQLLAADSVQVAITTADSVRVVLVGISTDSTRHDTIIRINGPDTVSTTPRRYLYIESVRIDSGHAMTSTLKILRATGNTHITGIRANNLADYTAHYYCVKEETPRIAHWSAGVKQAVATDTTIFQLRMSDDWLRSRSSVESAYMLLDQIAIVGAGVKEGNIRVPVLMPQAYSGAPVVQGRAKPWVAVYGKSSTGNADGWVTLDIETRGKSGDAGY